MRTNLYHGLVAGIAASVVAIIYMNVYSAALAVDFNLVANPMGAVFSALFGTMLAAVGRHFWGKWVKRNATLWFNVFFTVLTFLSIMPIFGMTLPLEVKAPGLFVGMVAPMHLFPQLFWHVSEPLFADQAA